MAKFKVDQKEFEVIKQMGFQVHKFTPYHYRISKSVGDVSIDVYPTRRTYVVHKDGIISKKQAYGNLVTAVELTVQ